MALIVDRKDDKIDLWFLRILEYGKNRQKFKKLPPLISTSVDRPSIFVSIAGMFVQDYMHIK